MQLGELRKTWKSAAWHIWVGEVDRPEPNRDLSAEGGQAWVAVGERRGGCVPGGCCRGVTSERNVPPPHFF